MLSQGAVHYFSNFAYYEGMKKTILDLVFDIFSDVGLPLGGFLMTLFIAKKWKIVNFNKELVKDNHAYMGSFMQKYLNFSLTVFAPIFLGLMFLITILNKFFGISIL
jgi:NSS family neurotransmitter:Na+ symporter